jgi:non-ribosomal peptide synthetase component E (peptide arylation enzyme)
MPVLQRYTRKDYEENYASGYWTADHLLGALNTYAKTAPDKLAVVDGDCRLTRSDLCELVARATGLLRENGVRSGDIVAVQLPNSAHIVILILALLKIGAIYHPINASYRQADITKIITVSRPKFYIYTRVFRSFIYGPLVEDLRRTVIPFISLQIDVDRPVADVFPASDRGDEPVAAPDPDALCLIGATSGSTGDPKLFMHTQNTQFNEARWLNREMGLGERDVFLAFAPITHRGVFMWGFVQSVAAGATLVIERTYDPLAIMTSIDRERVTTLFAIPSQVVELLDCCERGAARGSSLRVLMMAGAPVQPELVLRISSRPAISVTRAQRMPPMTATAGSIPATLATSTKTGT